MRHILTVLAALFLCSAPAQAQTMKALMYNTNGQVVANTGTNVLTFANNVNFYNGDIQFVATQILGNGLYIDFDDGAVGGGQITLDTNSSIAFQGAAAAITRTNLGLGATWLTNTNVTNFRTAIGLGSTNEVAFKSASFSATDNDGHVYAITLGQTNTGFKNVAGDTNSYGFTYLGTNVWYSAGSLLGVGTGLYFASDTSAAASRTNLRLGATWLTNTNVTNFRTAIGLGANDYVEFGSLALLDGNQIYVDGEIAMVGQFRFENTVFFNEPAETRNSLGLGASNIVTFAGLTNNGDITIANTTATNGLLFIRRTNNEAFLGMANLIASNNTTISNETLFRVGVAEATNKAAQFGFRSTNTNGNGVAVFSVFGFNALMQIGADALTNAVIFSGGGTNNEVMTLIRDGATEFARPLRFSTNALTRPATNAPSNTTNVAAWVEMRIGTNSYRVPLYQ